MEKIILTKSVQTILRNLNNKIYLIIFLTLFFIIIGCVKSKPVQKKLPPKKVVNEFLKLIQKDKYDSAFMLWDFEGGIREGYLDREDVKIEINRWKWLVKKWRKENIKPNVFGDPRKYRKKYYSVVIEWKAIPEGSTDYVDYESMVLVLESIKGEWKITGTLPEL